MFSQDPDISFWMKTVTPPGIDGGDAVENTTMHNSTWRTFSPRALATLTEATFTAAYDPNVYYDIVGAGGSGGILNAEGSITVHFPDGSTLDFFGYLRMFEPDALEEGSQPEATVTIQPTNWDPSAKVEAGPVMTEVVGT
jgi:hypothetical protein